MFILAVLFFTTLSNVYNNSTCAENTSRENTNAIYERIMLVNAELAHSESNTLQDVENLSMDLNASKSHMQLF